MSDTARNVEWLWTWGGACFGYRDDDDLWTREGRHVGQFYGAEVFGPGGRYLGELRGSKDDRLITNLAKKHLRRGSFIPHTSRVGHIRHTDAVGYAMSAGYEDFASTDDLQ
jgi:hypothetical protein